MHRLISKLPLLAAIALTLALVLSIAIVDTASANDCGPNIDVSGDSKSGTVTAKFNTGDIPEGGSAKLSFSNGGPSYSVSGSGSKSYTYPPERRFGTVKVSLTVKNKDGSEKCTCSGEHNFPPKPTSTPKPTNTPLPPTATSLPPTNTPEPTNTPAPTNTPEPTKPGETPEPTTPPTAPPTSVPPTAPPTSVPPTAPPTSVPPTAPPTSVPPTAVPPPGEPIPPGDIQILFNLLCDALGRLLAQPFEGPGKNGYTTYVEYKDLKTNEVFYKWEIPEIRSEDDRDGWTPAAPVYPTIDLTTRPAVRVTVKAWTEGGERKDYIDVWNKEGKVCTTVPVEVPPAADQPPAAPPAAAPPAAPPKAEPPHNKPNLPPTGTGDDLSPYLVFGLVGLIGGAVPVVRRIRRKAA